jgi:hypothetical protein
MLAALVFEFFAADILSVSLDLMPPRDIFRYDALDLLWRELRVVHWFFMQ